MPTDRTRVEDLGGFLRQQRHSAQLSLRQLATRAGVSNPYLSQVERGLRRPSADVLQQLARALQISSSALYTRAGLLDDAQPVPGAGDTLDGDGDGDGDGRGAVVAAIRADPRLDDRQRRALIDTYTAFVAAGTPRRDDPDPSDPGRQHS
ncbi:MAG: helix-turn-helix domain-containing protein [Kineosporiaceae bacterium]